MAIEKRSPGQAWRPLSAADHNAIAISAEFVRSNFLLGSPGATRRVDAPTTWLHVKNTTGGNRRRGDCLEVFDLLVSDLDEDALWFEGDTPLAGDAVFGILKEPSPTNEINRLQVSGDCIAWVNVTDEDHAYAKPASGEHVLQSASTGPVQIIYKPSGTGEKECAVLLGSNSGTTACDTVLFFAETVDATTRTVTASVIAVPEGCSLSDVRAKDASDLITVCDLAGCVFDEPADNLQGRYGWAKYMKPLVDSVCQDYQDPMWIAMLICCPTPDCE